MQVEEYAFEQKKLYAKHYEHKTDKKAPRVFISELMVEKFSEPFQKLVESAIEQIPNELINSNELIFAGSAFGNLLMKLMKHFVKSQNMLLGFMFMDLEQTTLL